LMKPFRTQFTINKFTGNLKFTDKSCCFFKGPFRIYWLRSARLIFSIQN
jgi:hypothetical protein